ncbi:DUF4214 domain-containing protein [Telluria mixta]|uniref:DUF4214 domain-containing protein n=1 Tax=Telluria mixta TaxID=34071 RepID=A0ABT2C2I5_9BURK|nr:DUF4214 domain-containing protein [Telluria mixta]MCS0631597.1 DUF4214 domain-containing protein [Telluria mixta]WEM98352.1 DUF4214 domain-containing protein [Telluria mixta]
MTTITMKFSQAVIDQDHALELQDHAFTNSFAGLFGNIEKYEQELNLGEPVSSTLSGSTLTVRYTSGATETYKNVVLDNPGGASGHGSANDYELLQSGVAGVYGTGKINFDYKVEGANTWLLVSTQGDVFDTLGVATDLKAGSSGYDPVFGNFGVGLKGNLNFTPQGDMIGSIGSMTLYAEKFLDSTRIDGNFYIDSSRPDPVGGVMTGYKELYRDGSVLQISGFSTTLNAQQNLDDAWSDGRYFNGDDVLSVDLPAHVYAPFMLQAGAGNDRVSLNGGGGQLGVMAGDGNDQVTLFGGAHTVDGGGGIDTVRLSVARADATVQRIGTSGSSYTVTDKAGTVDQLSGVERIAFSDATIALDIDGTAGQAYRIYQAAFNRTPDKAGLGYWINAMDRGASFTSVAKGFLDSDEYHKAYDGVASNRALVTKYYENILHRTPDAGGLDFWAGVLDSKAAGTADVLASISDSAENKAGLIGVIGNGFEYTPYGQG